MTGKVVVIFHAGDQRSEIFLELETDELLGPHVAQCVRPARVAFIPGVVDLLGDEVDPTTVCRGQNKSLFEGGGSDVDGVIVEVDEDVTIAIPLLKEKGVGAAYYIGLCAEVGQDVELLERSVRAEKTSLRF